jgi:diacylglycerol kinase family enzyme
VCGGDGSFHHAVSRALAIWGEADMPLLLPLRGGTINNLSRTLGARRRRPESMLAHVVKDHRQGQTHEIKQRDLIRVNGEHFGYIVGAGLIVNFLLAFSHVFRTSLIKGVVKSFEADVVCDGERVPFRAFTLLLASTVAHIGLGVRPFYMSARKRGYYHLLGGPSTPGQLLSRLYRFFRGYPADLDTLYDNMARNVVVKFAEPQAFTINGDIYDPVGVLQLEPGPRVSFISG